MIITKQPILWPPQKESKDALADALQMGVAGAKSAIQGAVAWVPPFEFGAGRERLVSSRFQALGFQDSQFGPSRGFGKNSQQVGFGSSCGVPCFLRLPIPSHPEATYPHILKRTSPRSLQRMFTLLSVPNASFKMYMVHSPWSPIGPISTRIPLIQRYMTVNPNPMRVAT